MNLTGFEPPPRPQVSVAERRQRILQMVKTASDLRAAGDIDGVLAMATEDIVWSAPAGWSYSTLPHTVRGKPAVRQALAERHIQFVFGPSLVRRLLIDGDSVILHRTTSSRPRGGGRMTSFDVVDLLLFRDGLVAEITEFPDGRARERLRASD